MDAPWPSGEPGLLVLPSGRAVRGRALSRPAAGTGAPQFGLYLLGRDPGPMPWPSRWIRWPDFRLPSDPVQAHAALVQAWGRAPYERVEIACSGGRGRTGTALACLAILDGVAARDAVDFVRRHYDPRAVETRRQARYVRRFPSG